jgi:TolB protein
VWSPDGSRIAFTSRRDGNDELYVMDADGSNQTRLTFANGHDNGPDWTTGTIEIERKLYLPLIQR